jgi:DNA-binding response OmpR family regulator
MKGYKVLIVDDDHDIRRGLGLRLRASKFETCFAADAATAVTVAHRERPDVILLDIGLPAGDGFLVLERLKNIPNLAAIPVIVISAKDPHHVKDRLFAAGADGFFQKPVDNAELLRVIEASLANS